MTDPSSGPEWLAGRVATTGIIAGLLLTAIGMLASSPVAGAAGLIVIMILVLARRPIAGLIGRWTRDRAR